MGKMCPGLMWHPLAPSFSAACPPQGGGAFGWVLLHPRVAHQGGLGQLFKQ